jgi:hypothetical protein
MAQTVGGLNIDLSANTATFQRDMGKAVDAVSSAAARMNRDLAVMEKGFRAAATGLQTFVLRGALAVMGIQSVGAAVRGALGTMRDMTEQAQKLGVHVDKDMAQQAAAAARQVDILAFSIREKLAESIANWMNLLPPLRERMQQTFGLESLSIEDLGKSLAQQISNISDLEKKLADLEKRKISSAKPAPVLGGIFKRYDGDAHRAAEEAKMPGSDETLTRKALEDARRTRAEIEKILAGRSKDGMNPGLLNDEVYDQWVRDNTVVRDRVYEVAAALKFQEEQVGRTALQQRVWNELNKAGVDLNSEAGMQIMQMVHSLQAQEDALNGVGIAVDEVYQEWKAWSDAQYDGLNQAFDEAAWEDHIAKLREMFKPIERDEVHEQWKELQEEGKRAWDHIKESSADALTDALLKVRSLKDALRAVGMEIARMLMNRMVATPIVDAISGGLSGMWANFGGARASGGPVSAGMSYLVGENGPEMFTPSAGGNITANNKLGSGGGTTVYIDAKGADKAAIARLTASLRAVNASIETRAVAAVGRSRARGRA